MLPYLREKGSSGAITPGVVSLYGDSNFGEVAMGERDQGPSNSAMKFRGGVMGKKMAPGLDERDLKHQDFGLWQVRISVSKNIVRKSGSNGLRGLAHLGDHIRSASLLRAARFNGGVERAAIFILVFIVIGRLGEKFNYKVGLNFREKAGTPKRHWWSFLFWCCSIEGWRWKKQHLYALY